MDRFKIALLILWAIATALVCSSFYLRVKKPKNDSFEISELIVLAGCIAGIVANINLLRLIFFSEYTKELINVLDIGDIITLLIGPIAVTWVAIQEIFKLFKP
jgi:purine-cytosine permease-like protein